MMNYTAASHLGGHRDVLASLLRSRHAVHLYIQCMAGSGVSCLSLFTAKPQKKVSFSLRSSFPFRSVITLNPEVTLNYLASSASMQRPAVECD